MRKLIIAGAIAGTLVFGQAQSMEVRSYGTAIGKGTDYLVQWRGTCSNMGRFAVQGVDHTFRYMGPAGSGTASSALKAIKAACGEHGYVARYRK